MDNVDLVTMTGSELVSVYNGLNPTKSLKQWKGSKKELIRRINVLHDNTTEKAPKAISAEPKTDVPQKTVVVKPAAETKAKTTKKPATDTIRATAIDLLCHVAFYEDRNEKPGTDNVVEEGHKQARSVGIAYDEIIRRIKEKFPSCKTTVACLRWYSVKIRVEELGYEDLQLPQRRPRVKSKYQRKTEK